MIPPYTQAILNGHFAEAERIANLLSPALPLVTVAERLDLLMPPGLKQLIDEDSQLARFQARIEALVGGPLDQALSHMQWAADLEPYNRFARIAQMIASPMANLQEQAEQINRLFGVDAATDDSRAGGMHTTDAPKESAGVVLGDMAVAHVLEDANTIRLGQLWASLSNDAKFGVWVTILLALISALTQIPSYINDYRELRDGSDGLTQDQGRQLVMEMQTAKAALAKVMAAQQQAADRDAQYQRESLALQRESRMLLESMVGQPCEVLTATSVRELGRVGQSKRQLDRLEPGDMVLCMGHQGKWLQVAYDGKDGIRIYGYVRKKHVTWEDVR